jgi:hypothetical protein
VDGGGFGADGRVMGQVMRAGKLRPEKENGAGVIDPDEQGDQRRRRAVNRCDRRMPEIERDQIAPETEQQRSQRGTDPHVAPPQPHVGHHLEKKGEQNGDDGQRGREIDAIDQQGRRADSAVNHAERCRQRGTQHQ